MINKLNYKFNKIYLIIKNCYIKILKNSDNKI